MQPEKRKQLEDKGWTAGTVDKFLGTNMITPDQFKSADELIDDVNLKKIDLLTNTGWSVCIGKYE